MPILFLQRRDVADWVLAIAVGLAVFLAFVLFVWSTHS